MKRFFLIAVAAVLLFATTDASALTWDYSYQLTLAGGGSWSFDFFSTPLDIVAHSVDVTPSGGSQTTIISPAGLMFGTLHILTGALTGGDGSLATPWTWAAGSMSITGGTVCGVDCFVGTFGVSTGLSTDGGLNWDPVSLVGMIHVNTAAYAMALGLTVADVGSTINVTGHLNAALDVDDNSDPTVGSGDVIAKAVIPEPATLALFGTGLVGVGSMLRWRMKRGRA